MFLWYSFANALLIDKITLSSVLYFNLDFKATIEKQQINTAELLQVIERFCLKGGVS